MPSLAHADNIYFRDEFTTKDPNWEFTEYKDIHSFTWQDGKLTIRNDKTHTEASAIQQTTIPIDMSELWVHFAIKLNEGPRYGKIYLSFYDESSTYYHYLLYFMGNSDISKHGTYGLVHGTTTTGRNYQIFEDQWLKESINIGETFSSRFPEVTLTTLKSIQVCVWATNEIPVECSFDYLRISKSEYVDLEEFPTIVPDNVEVFQEFEFTTTHFIILVIVGVALFILINKNRRKKSRNYIKKYLKV